MVDTTVSWRDPEFQHLLRVIVPWLAAAALILVAYYAHLLPVSPQG